LWVILGDGPGGLVMTLAGYFDESERQEGSEPISIAGYVFRPKGYKHFNRKWARMLEAGPRPTTHFHMTNLYAADYEYKGWSVEERAEVLRQAVDAVRKHTYFGVSVLFSQKEFEAMAPRDWVVNFGSIYSAACQVLLRATGYWMDEKSDPDRIAYVFESGHQFWSEANAILTGITADQDTRQHYRYISHTAIPKERAYGLQAADMLSWIMTRLEIGFPNNHTMRAFAPILMRLAEGQSSRYQLFHPKGDLLRRFFEEQINAEHVILSLGRPKKLRLR
jgi:hypothetical protein